jgi:hypothetical protein
LEVNRRTVRRRLNEHGLFGRLAADEYDYSDKQLDRREHFGLGYQNLKEEDWELVLALDEKQFTCDSHSGRDYVQRPPGERYNPKFMHQKHTYDRHNPSPFMNALVCFSGRGLCFIHCYTDELNTKLLLKILKKNLISGETNCTKKEKIGKFYGITIVLTQVEK